MTGHIQKRLTSISCIPNGITQRYVASWTFMLINHVEKTSNCYVARSPEFQMTMTMMMMTSSLSSSSLPLSSLLYFSLAGIFFRQLCSTTVILIWVNINIGSIRNKFVEQIMEKLAFLYDDNRKIW